MLENTQRTERILLPVGEKDNEKGSLGTADGRYGILPGGGAAPLATGWVPWQKSADPMYAPDEALSQGTLFPGLNLPFKNIMNSGTPYAGTPLGEVLAVSFAAHELVLYLDTHKDDAEAFAVLKGLLELKKEAHRRYTEKYGPLNTEDLINETHYTWVKSPFPWDYEANEKGGSK